MTNLMKHTICMSCNPSRNLENMSWDKYLEHIAKHEQNAKDNEKQKRLDQF